MPRGLVDLDAGTAGPRLARAGRPTSRSVGTAGSLPSSHWRRYPVVRWPGTGAGRIDEVVVGPSGVHVVLRHGARRDEDAVGPDGLPVPDVTTAARAAVAVAALLPERYRARVRPELCLDDAGDVGTRSGPVLIASAHVLEHTWRHGPRVLSTSEILEIGRRLDVGLEPIVTQPCMPARWQRLRRLLLRAG